MRKSKNREPFLERAGEEAEDTELLERVESDVSLEHEREEAQGIEVFEDPGATLPAAVLKEGSPGHESLTGNSVGLGRDADEDRGEEPEESW